MELNENEQTMRSTVWPLSRIHIDCYCSNFPCVPNTRHRRHASRTYAKFAIKSNYYELLLWCRNADCPATWSTHADDIENVVWIYSFLGSMDCLLAMKLIVMGHGIFAFCRLNKSGLINKLATLSLSFFKGNAEGAANARTETRNWKIWNH